MPSPFPGMDPFLEHPEVFPDLHGSFITYLRESLRARLPKPYYAIGGERVYLTLAERPIGPDLDVRRRRHERGARGNGVAAAAVLRTPPTVVRAPTEEHRESYLDIYRKQAEGDRLVAHIEVLSPSNKSAGPGHHAYRRKQREVSRGKAHLIEIDLSRGGNHVTAVPLEALSRRVGAFDYHVCVRRFNNPDAFWVHAFQLADGLPEIAVPLLSREGVIGVDLQAVFDRTYDTGPYELRIRYDNPDGVVPPLTPEQSDWAKQLLRKQGLLPKRRGS